MVEKELLNNKDVKDYCNSRNKKIFNFNSSKQLSELLFEDMNLKPVKFTDKKNPSLDKDALEILSKKHKNKFLHSIVGYRKLQKFHKTYIKSYFKLAKESSTNKLHTNYKLHGTATGRFSSSNPNLQNIPKHGGGDKLIRRCFIARKGYTFLEADYSQLEFRIFAHCSNDLDLIKIADEEDIHTTMASKIFNIPLDKVSKEQRSLAKTAVFGGIMYGGGPSIIVNKFGVSFQKAERIINDFFENFPTAYNYIVNEKKFVQENGYVVNLFNRRRRLDGVYSNKEGIKKSALRQAINAPIQGGGADVVLIAMNKVYKAIQNIDCTLLLNIHDSLIFEIENSILKETVIKIKEVMEKPVNLRVPLVVTTEIGTNLGNLEEIKVTF
jgi:DNA polymerase-1